MSSNLLRQTRAMHSIAIASFPGCNFEEIGEPGDEAIVAIAILAQ